MPQGAPKFKRGQRHLKVDDLNFIAGALQDVVIDGAEVRRVGNVLQVRLLEKTDEILVRVYLVEPYASYGHMHGPLSCAGKNVYRWVEQVRTPCNEVIDAEHGRTGEATDNPAFEEANVLVEDGSIQTITPGWYYTDDNHRQIQEWVFSAGGGGTESAMIEVVTCVSQSVLTP